MKKHDSKLTIGIILDKRGDPPYISVNKLWNQTVHIISRRYDTEILYVDSYEVESDERYRRFVNKIDIMMLLSPYYTIDRTVKDISVIFYGLGSMQKGGHWLCDNQESFRCYDEAILNCTACASIFEDLVKNDSIGHALIPFGVDVSVFAPKNRKKDLRKKYGIPEDVFIMLYCGRINLQKNPTLLLSLLRDFKDKYDKLRLMFVGSYDRFYISEFNDGEVPDIRAEFLKLIDVFDLSDRIIFFENQSDAETYAEIINMADIGINLTTLISENFGYTIVEMQSCGLPVIGTEWGGQKDTVIDGETGFLVETIQSSFGARINIESAKECIEYFINSPDEVERMGKNARKNIEKRFSETVFSENLYNIIEKTYNNFINNKKRENDLILDPLVKDVSVKIHELYGESCHVSLEHLHPEINFTHYDKISSRCASCNANDKVWCKNSMISKGFDWTIMNGKFISYDPRWNTNFELKDLYLDNNEISFLKLINDGYTVTELLKDKHFQKGKIYDMLKALTVKGILMPWEKGSNGN